MTALRGSLLLLTLGSCGGPSAGGPDASASCASLTSPADQFSNGTCSTCLKAMCCAETGACASNRECLALTACWNACTSGNACLLACEDMHPAGKADFLASRTCSASSCSYISMGATYQCSFSF